FRAVGQAADDLQPLGQLDDAEAERNLPSVARRPIRHAGEEAERAALAQRPRLTTLSRAVRAIDAGREVIALAFGTVRPEQAARPVAVELEQPARDRDRLHAGADSQSDAVAVNDQRALR